MSKENCTLTPQQVSEWIDVMPPIEIKNRLLDYLLWQAAHGKKLLHSAHYFRIIHYGYQPREATIAKRTERVRSLTQQIGHGGGSHGTTRSGQEQV